MTGPEDLGWEERMSEKHRVWSLGALMLDLFDEMVRGVQGIGMVSGITFTRMIETSGEDWGDPPPTYSLRIPRA